MSSISSIPSIPSAMSSATSAINKAVKAVEKDAQSVADSQRTLVSKSFEEFVDSTRQVMYTQAAAKIINATDHMAKSLVDMMA